MSPHIPSRSSHLRFPSPPHSLPCAVRQMFYNRQAHATLRVLSPVEYENLNRVVLQACPESPR
jgi:hypothetical protein